MIENTRFPNRTINMLCVRFFELHLRNICDHIGDIKERHTPKCAAKIKRYTKRDKQTRYYQTDRVY